jgi:hypothetical protein
MRLETRDNSAFLSVARQLHLGVLCVYVAVANDMSWPARRAGCLGVNVNELTASLGNPNDGD